MLAVSGSVSPFSLLRHARTFFFAPGSVVWRLFRLATIHRGIRSRACRVSSWDQVVEGGVHVFVVPSCLSHTAHISSLNRYFMSDLCTLGPRSLCFGCFDLFLFPFGIFFCPLRPSPTCTSFLSNSRGPAMILVRSSSPYLSDPFRPLYQLADLATMGFSGRLTSYLSAVRQRLQHPFLPPFAFLFPVPLCTVFVEWPPVSAPSHRPLLRCYFSPNRLAFFSEADPSGCLSLFFTLHLSSSSSLTNSVFCYSFESGFFHTLMVDSSSTSPLLDPWFIVREGLSEWHTFLVRCSLLRWVAVRLLIFETHCSSRRVIPRGIDHVLTDAGSFVVRPTRGRGRSSRISSPISRLPLFLPLVLHRWQIFRRRSARAGHRISPPPLFRNLVL